MPKSIATPGRDFFFVGNFVYMTLHLVETEENEVTQSEVRNYLEQAYRAKELIDSMQEELVRLQGLVEETSFTGRSRKQGSFLAALIEKENRQKRRIAEYAEAVDEIHRVLDALQDPTLRLILQLRYLNFQSWEEIAAKLNYSTVWMFTLHKRALVEAGKIIEAAEQQAASQ